MRRYRYRTSVLVGPWRETFEQAVADAVRCNQAYLDDAGLVWRVPGRIEADGMSEGEDHD